MIHVRYPSLFGHKLFFSPTHPTVALSHGGYAITQCKRDENPYVEKCTLSVTPQKLTSSLAPSPLLAVRRIRCDCLWRCNIVADFTQEFSGNVIMVDRRNTTMSQRLRACSTANCIPQVHWRGKFNGYQPYLRHRASGKALCNAKPRSAIGRVDSQLDAPFSVDKLFA